MSSEVEEKQAEGDLEEIRRLQNLVYLKKRYPRVCGAGLGSVTVHFPDGRRKCLVFYDSEQAIRALYVLEDWLAAYVTDVKKRREETVNDEE